MNNCVRNFAIIAHIDHGKSTLADCLIQYCGGLEKREMTSQVLDSMELEKEKGITIKAQMVRLYYKADDGNTYQLNLIDTPGHVDFSYEVSRALSAVEGSLLIVDASQGVEAQTLANLYKAIEADNEIVPIINKIDLPAADPDKVAEEIENVIGIDTSNKVLISAKNNIGIKDVLEAIVKYVPPPKQDTQSRLSALLVDSWYDQYLGIVILIRLITGSIKKGMKIKMMSTGSSYTVDNVGYFTPKKQICNDLNAGEVGFITASIKDVSDCKVGDTITDEKNPIDKPLKGFNPNLPVVFCGLYPEDTSQFEHLKESLAKLKLNDSSFEFEIESSTALGMGFRCGFLGLLHLEIIQERLEREYHVSMTTTSPSVIYKVHTRKKEILKIHNPCDLPDPVQIDYIEEPWMKATILVTDNYLGPILELCTDKRGIQEELTYVNNRAMLVYKLPLNEVVFDFYDKLKSVSKGYASFDWSPDSYVKSDVVKLNILVNSEPVDAFAMIVHKTKAEARGRAICAKLKELIPRQLFKIPIQASIGGKVIARETIAALRKDVLAKCYGGDITRKRKLLEKQKAGKKKMRNIGNVEIPKKAFIEALKVDN